MKLNFLSGLSSNLPTNRDNGTFYHTTDDKKIYLNDIVLEDTENVKNTLLNYIYALSEEIMKLKSHTTLHLHAYLFDLNGTYTKQQFEEALSVTLEELVESMSNGNEITIFSSDDTTDNISFITESNYTLTSDGELKTLTLQWHQYQLWCTLYATLNSNKTYTINIDKA